MDTKEFLKDTFLFKGVSDEEYDAILKDHLPFTKEYKRGEEVFSSTDDRLVGFVVSGECEVRRIKADGSRIVLNILRKNGSFGILSVFSDEEYPTHIFATRNSKILYFAATQIEYFVNNNLHIATNLIDFLVGRISFLNKKVATFSGNRVDTRLSAFLLCQRDEYGDDSFPFNCQKTAEEIGVGRASVYRALDSLRSDGLISLDNKKIYILDPKGLERNTK